MVYEEEVMLCTVNYVFYYHYYYYHYYYCCAYDVSEHGHWHAMGTWQPEDNG